MKKVIIGVLIACVFILGGIGAYLILTNQSRLNSTDTDSSTESAHTKSTIDACIVMPASAVKEFVGRDVQKVDTPDTASQTSDITITSCNYVAQTSNSKTGASLSGASLMVRVARNTAGANSNKSEFQNKPAEAKTVKGIGDDAFYNPDFKQLHVLKNGNWYVLTAYRDSILNSSLESNKELALKLTFQ